MYVGVLVVSPENFSLLFLLAGYGAQSGLRDASNGTRDRLCDSFDAYADWTKHSPEAFANGIKNWCKKA